MGRSGKELRRSLAPVTGVTALDDQSLLRTAVPPEQPTPLALTVKNRAQQLRSGYLKGPKT
jgi:hypothetical protein